MMKKIQNLSGISVIMVVALLVVLGAVGFVKAIDKSPTYVIENIEQANFTMEDASLGDFEDSMSLGASGTRFPNGVSADSTSPIAGELRGTTLTLTGAGTIAGAVDVARLTQGGEILATSTDGVTTSVLTEAQLISNVSIDFTLSTEATHTLTLPATSTLTTFIPTAGDSAIMRIRVLGTAASASSTITAGTGMDLVENENGDVVIEAGNEAYLRFYRESDTDVTVSVDEYIAAD